METSTDEFDFAACIARVRADDESAARDLVEQLHPLVMRIAHAQRPAAIAAEDIAQEVFAKVFQRLDQYQGRAPFPHWVARITTLACLEHRRRAWVRRELRWSDLSEEQQAVLTADPEAVVPNTVERPRDAAGLVRQLLDTLPEKERLIITLLDLEGKSVAEICSLTGWGASRVKVTAWRVRRKLGKTAQRLRLHEAAES
ncbi:MAG: sigma-70 family RNA polymerase sigma factor [Opitutaceae bacterium]|nr:sigma-70 family RNA polymerase sigma factor [Opitutaceae bacterium]